MLAETYSCSCIMLEFFSEIILQLAGREQKNQKWILCYGDEWNVRWKKQPPIDIKK